MNIFHHIYIEVSEFPAVYSVCCTNTIISYVCLPDLHSTVLNGDSGEKAWLILIFILPMLAGNRHGLKCIHLIPEKNEC